MMRPVKAWDLPQKKPAGRGCFEKSANVVPSPGVRHRSLPLVMTRSKARAGRESNNRPNTEIRVSLFMRSPSPFDWKFESAKNAGLPGSPLGGARALGWDREG